MGEQMNPGGNVPQYTYIDDGTDTTINSGDPVYLDAIIVGDTSVGIVNVEDGGTVFCSIAQTTAEQNGYYDFKGVAVDDLRVDPAGASLVTVIWTKR